MERKASDNAVEWKKSPRARPLNEKMRPARRIKKQMTFEDRRKHPEPKGKVKLEDFEILKVIDKGSFGKVFLVELKSSGNLYAMKRIRKDILIEKG